MMTANERARFNRLTTDDIHQVYSGIDGRCCCGCSGKHSYNSKGFVPSADGYPSMEDVNDRMVKKVLNILKNADVDEIDACDTYFATVVGKRLYIAYLRKE